jgi:hypothetical protein
LYIAWLLHWGILLFLGIKTSIRPAHCFNTQ